LKLSNAERDRISWLVGSLARLERFASLTRSDRKRLLTAEGIGELLALGRAVALAETGDDSHVRACEIYLRDQPDGPIDPPPLLSGSDLIAHGYRPGPGFAELLESVRDAQLEGTIRDKDEALRWLGSRPSPLRVLPSP
jgi:poly(A) polymerase